MAISSALNSFSLDLARHVVEDLCLGKLLYAGGDDVMAMVCVRDLPKALWLLRLVYSGGMPGEAGEKLFPHDLDINNGFVKRGDWLHRVMGARATASSGAVVAHYMAPLGTVLRQLRHAEQAAKNNGRNAFSIQVIKRAGGSLELTLPWWLGQESSEVSPMHALEDLRGELAGDMSRRAAYHATEWIKRLHWPEDPDELRNLLSKNLEYQFKRKGGEFSARHAERIAQVAVGEALRRTGGKVEAGGGSLAKVSYQVVEAMLHTAEFLAREQRGANEMSVHGEKVRGVANG